MQSAEKPLRKRKQSLKVAELLLEGTHGPKAPSSSNSYTPSEDPSPFHTTSSPDSSDSTSSSGSGSSWSSGSEGEEEEEEEEVGVARHLAPPHMEEGDSRGVGSPNSNSSP